MSKMTAAEVVSEIYERSRIGRGAVPASVQHHVGEALSNVAVIVRDNLVPRWQSVPDGDGYYWIESEHGPRHVFKTDYGRWMYQLLDLSYVALHYRVCPVGPRPKG